MSRAEPPPLHVIARAPFQIYYEGTARAVSASNRVGPFDILPGHTDFFSMLEPGEIIIETGGQPVAFIIHHGIITVRDDQVMLFINM